jgi:hypothetical protein
MQHPDIQTGYPTVVHWNRAQSGTSNHSVMSDISQWLSYICYMRRFRGCFYYCIHVTACNYTDLHDGRVELTASWIFKQSHRNPISPCFGSSSVRWQEEFCNIRKCNVRPASYGTVVCVHASYSSVSDFRSRFRHLFLLKCLAAFLIPFRKMRHSTSTSRPTFFPIMHSQSQYYLKEICSLSFFSKVTALWASAAFSVL